MPVWWRCRFEQITCTPSGSQAASESHPPRRACRRLRHCRRGRAFVERREHSVGASPPRPIPSGLGVPRELQVRASAAHGRGRRAVDNLYTVRTTQSSPPTLGRPCAFRVISPHSAVCASGRRHGLTTGAAYRRNCFIPQARGSRGAFHGRDLLTPKWVGAGLCGGWTRRRRPWTA